MENTTCKGESSYDYRYDILTFRVKARDYRESIELQNVVVDIDTNGGISGVRIMDASKVFDISKHALRNITEGNFKATVKNNIITISLRFAGQLRNKSVLVGEKQNYIQQITTKLEPGHPLGDSTIECPI